MENTIDLKEEIIQLSNKTKFNPLLLEKDYHLTRILEKISGRKIENLIFKGGTCLNKCYLGFYRLSEDLDFVLNKDVKGLTKLQVRKILDSLRRTMFEILNELELGVNQKLGEGWKMLTSKEEPKIVGLEIISTYKSIIDGSTQKIKIEISFRRKLINPTQTRPIHHEFINALGEPILKEDVKIEAIDLSENFAEKFRALVTRKNIAIRDIFDIHFITSKNILKIDNKTRELSLLKIKETLGQKYSKEDLINFMKNLSNKTSSLDEKELLSVLKSGESANVKSMVKEISDSFLSSVKN